MLFSQYLKVDGVLTVFWRGLLPVIFVAPLMFFIKIPTSPIFYLATIGTSLIASYTDVKSMNGAIKFGAGVSLRMGPYTLWGVFLVWFALSSTYREQFLSNPLIGSGVVVALICVAIGSSFLRKCEVSRQAFLYYFPVLICGVFVDILNKTAMDASTIWGGILTYAWIQGLIITASCFVRQKYIKKRLVSEFFSRKTLYVGGVVGGLFLVANMSKYTAMTHTVNPAYVTAIILSSSVWVSLFYRLKGEKEEANEFAGLLVVASSIMLVILASNMS